MSGNKKWWNKKKMKPEYDRQWSCHDTHDNVQQFSGSTKKLRTSKKKVSFQELRQDEMAKIGSRVGTSWSEQISLLKENTIRDGGSTAQYAAAYTVDTVMWDLGPQYLVAARGFSPSVEVLPDHLTTSNASDRNELFYLFWSK